MKVLQFFIFTVFMSGLLITSSVADRLYTWIDKNGVTHITKEPPPKSARQVDSMGYKPAAASVQEPSPIDERLPEGLERNGEENNKTSVSGGTDMASDEQAYDDNDGNQLRRGQRKEEQNRLKKDSHSDRRELREPGSNSRQYYLEKRRQQKSSGDFMQSAPSANQSAGGRK